MNRKSSMLASVAAVILAALTGRAPGQCTGYNMTTVPGQGPVPGITDIGNHGHDVLTIVPLPFPVSFYGQTYTVAIASSNGLLTMGPTGTSAHINLCLPDSFIPNVPTLCPFWGDMVTSGTGHGIFTATYGTAPNRYFAIEWRAGYTSTYNGTADFGIILREGLPYFDFEYLTVSDGSGPAQSEGAHSTVGVQASGTGPASLFECNSGGLTNGEYVRFTCAPYQAPSCSLSLSDAGDYAGTPVSVFCTVTPGSGPVSTGLGVSLDASAIGGGIVTLHDDGVAPDATANDHIFSGTVTSGAAVAPGSYTLTSTVSDAQGRSSTCAATYWIIAPPGVCSGYNITVSQVSQLIPTSTDIGNHGDDALTTITLPFPVSVYGQTFTQATVCSNGQMTMGAVGTAQYFNYCLPSTVFPNVALAPFWDDLVTTGAGHGIFTATYQSAPYRAFVIEWRAGYYAGYTGTADFEVVLYENEPYFDYLYGLVNDGSGSAQSEGASSTIGAQASVSGPAAQFSCNAGGLFNGEWLRFTCAQYSPLSCSMSTPAAGGLAGTPFTAYCSVSPGSGPVSTGLAVSLDASAIGGGILTLHDDGVAPDQVANDHIFSGTVTPALGAPAGSYTLTSTVSDAQGRSSNCASAYLITPTNDECEGAIPAVLGNNVFDNTFATTSQGRFCTLDGYIGNDLWFTFTTPTSGALSVSTHPGTTVNTNIGVYADCTGCHLMASDSDGNDVGLQHTVTFCTGANQTYLIRIGGAGGARWAGTFNVSMETGAFAAPADAILEGEPCGNTGPDTVNGGCAFQPNRFSEAALCHSYRGGTSNEYDSYRDLDWYHLTMPATGNLHVVGQTDFPAFCQINSFPCASSTQRAFALIPGTTCGAGTIDITAALSGPADYMIIIGPVSYENAVPCGVAGDYWFSLHSDSFACPSPDCCRNDYNGDGDAGTDADIEAFFSCLAGNCCATCPPNADFNCDGDVGTDADVESFFRVLAGGSC
jgi:hypothetical protein